MTARGHSRAKSLVTGIATLAIAACWAGCEAVPDIRFVDEDARLDAPEGEGGGGIDSSAKDAGLGPCGPSPEPGATCCGSVWCIGQCDQANCNACAGKCGQGEVCCGKTGNVVCKAKCP